MRMETLPDEKGGKAHGTLPNEDGEHGGHLVLDAGR
jgi:hypothetical protein